MISLAGLLALALAQWQTQGMRVNDHGAVAGYATQVNCTGSGVTCTSNGTVWTLDFTGGSGGGAPTDAPYLVMAPVTGLSAEVVVPTCSAGQHLYSNGTAITCTADAAGGHAISDEGGAALTSRPTLNFTGAAVTATDNAGANRTDVTIPLPTLNQVGQPTGDRAFTWPSGTKMLWTFTGSTDEAFTIHGDGAFTGTGDLAHIHKSGTGATAGADALHVEVDADTNMTGIRSTVPSGSNAITLHTTGSRLKLSNAGTTDYLTSNGTTTISAGGTFSAPALSSSAASGANGLAFTTSGARLDLGAGANDYFSSNGTTISTPGALSSGSFSSTGNIVTSGTGQITAAGDLNATANLTTYGVIQGQGGGTNGLRLTSRRTPSSANPDFLFTGATKSADTSPLAIWRSSAGSDYMILDQVGNLTVDYGTITTGALASIYWQGYPAMNMTLQGRCNAGVGAEPCWGVTADSEVALTNPASRLFVISNGGTAKSYFDLNGNFSGNAATASAFDHDPIDCGVGAYVTGVSATGALSCSTPPATPPGGADTNIQYNSGGAFGGSAAFTYGASGVTFTPSAAAQVRLTPNDNNMDQGVEVINDGTHFAGYYAERTGYGSVRLDVSTVPRLRMETGAGLAEMLNDTGRWTFQAPGGARLVETTGGAYLDLSGAALTFQNGPTAQDVLRPTVSRIDATGTPSSTTFLRGDGTWAAPPTGSGSSNATQVLLDFGADGSDTTSTTVTGLPWMTANSRIVCSATMRATADRAEGAEDAAIERITVYPHSVVPGTGFSVTATPMEAPAVGKFVADCTVSNDWAALTARATPTTEGCACTGTPDCGCNTGYVTCSATGGLGGYTYSWTVDDGSVTISNSTSATSRFGALGATPGGLTATATCTATDGTSSASVNVPLDFIFDIP